MSRPRVYLDEDVYYALALGLRGRGFDVLTTFEAARRGSTDEEQLGHLTEQGRCLFTFNRGHFARLHALFLAQDRHHPGIIVCRQGAVGPVLRAFLELVSSRQAEELVDQLVWLFFEW